MIIILTDTNTELGLLRRSQWLRIILISVKCRTEKRMGLIKARSGHKSKIFR